jgi:hypothetical protein
MAGSPHVLGPEHPLQDHLVDLVVINAQDDAIGPGSTRAAPNDCGHHMQVL